jgi:hypothetical protein
MNSVIEHKPVGQKGTYILSLGCDMVLFVDALCACMGLSQSFPRLSAHRGVRSTDFRTNGGVETLNVGDEPCRDPLLYPLFVRSMVRQSSVLTLIAPAVCRIR